MTQDIYQDIYKELGIPKMINAAGTYTIVGGSRMSTQTLQAMQQAASGFVMIRDLQRAVHARLAELTHNEGAYVSNGAATGIYLSVAAAVQKKFGRSFNRLRTQTIANSNVVMFKAHRNPYDLVVKHLGMQYRELSFPNTIFPPTEEELRDAIDENTVAILYAVAGWMPPGDMPLEKVVPIAREAGIPVIVDAAAQLPPVENLWRFTERGADVVVFSGGKDLRGPQASGLVVGKRPMMEIVTELGFPNYGIGRMMKVGREELVGLLAAVEQYLQMDHAARRRASEEMVQQVIDRLAVTKGFRAVRSFPNEAGQPIPRAQVFVQNGMRADEVVRQLRAGTPSIFVNDEGPETFFVNPMTLEEGEMSIILDRLLELDTTT